MTGGFGIIFSILLVTWATIWIHSRFPLNRVNIVSVYWVFFLFMLYIPGMFVVGRSNDPLCGLFLFSITLSAVSMAAGLWLGGYRRGLGRVSSAQVSLAGDEYHGLERTLLLSTIGCGLVACLYFVEVPEIPLIYAIRNPGESAVLVGMRDDSFRLLGSKFLYLYYVVRQFVWAFVIGACLVAWLQTHRRPFLVMFWVNLIFGLFYAMASLIRGPAAAILIVSIVAWNLYRAGKIKFLHIVGGISSILALPIGILFLFSPDRSLGNIIEGIFDRIFLLPAEIAFEHFRAFPIHGEFLLGRSIDKIASIVQLWNPSYQMVDVANYVFIFMYPDSPFKSGAAPAAFQGEAYANFGVPGVLLFSVLAGWIMAKADRWGSNVQGRPLGTAAHAVMVYGFWELNRTALNQVLLSFGALSIIIVYNVFRWVERRCRRSVLKVSDVS